jgi:hypothetical protein
VQLATQSSDIAETYFSPASVLGARAPGHLLYRVHRMGLAGPDAWTAFRPATGLELRVASPEGIRAASRSIAQHPELARGSRPAARATVYPFWRTLAGLARCPSRMPAGSVEDPAPPGTARHIVPSPSGGQVSGGPHRRRCPGLQRVVGQPGRTSELRARESEAWSP